MTATGTELILTTSSLGNPPFPDAIDAASAAGFTGLSIWPQVDHDQALAAGLGDRDLRARIDDAGLRVHDVDALIRWVGPDDPGPPYFEEAPDDVLWHVAALVGAPCVNLLLVGGRAATFDDAVEALARACDDADRHGMAVTIEFAGNTAVPDLATAVRLIEASGCRNATVLLDVWHQHWGRTTLDDVAGPLGRHISAVQLCDGPRDRPADFAHATRWGRLAPTEGAFALPEIVTALAGHGFHGPYTVEVINDQLPTTLGVHGAAAHLAARTRSLFAQVPPAPAPGPAPAPPAPAT